MRTVLLAVLGLAGGFVVGVVVVDIGARAFGTPFAAVFNPITLAVIGAVAVPVVDLLARRRSR